MIGFFGNVWVYLVCGVIDMCCGIGGLLIMVEVVIKEILGFGVIFGFCGKCVDWIKFLWWDG